jgi:mannosyltransferase OCH1-like enzyme
LNTSIPEDRSINDLQLAHTSWHVNNPTYPIYYFDLFACRQYIQTYYHPLFLRAFDCIEAYTGKGNLFKYLVIYREGGWYSDWKQTCLVPNLLDKLSEPIIDEDGVKKNVTFFAAQQISRTDCYQNAFYGATPQHPVLSNVIKHTFRNIQSNYYGSNPYETTGVCVFGRPL